MKITVKVGTLGRAQIPMKIRQSQNIKPGDTLIIELKEVIHSDVSEAEASA
ncbi:AbrB/MazE/SpoVT family DNA-binding domain-containing protein [Cuniculiplasma sp. SKW4]|uniref:AbrB/MazE/SpoVT family DNA-binding domain-containing protein n=1 Tax=Cuniculiplasma sp. SKW4 TaxID=3400171 RepID=UPI003FD18B5A